MPLRHQLRGAGALEGASKKLSTASSLLLRLMLFVGLRDQKPSTQLDCVGGHPGRVERQRERRHTPDRRPHARVDPKHTQTTDKPGRAISTPTRLSEIEKLRNDKKAEIGYRIKEAVEAICRDVGAERRSAADRQRGNISGMGIRRISQKSDRARDGRLPFT